MNGFQVLMIGSVASLGLRSRLSASSYPWSGSVAADPGIDPAPLSCPAHLGIDPADLCRLGTSRVHLVCLWTDPLSDFSAVWMDSDPVWFHF